MDALLTRIVVYIHVLASQTRLDTYTKSTKNRQPDEVLMNCIRTGSHKVNPTMTMVPAVMKVRPL